MRLEHRAADDQDDHRRQTRAAVAANSECRSVRASASMRSQNTLGTLSTCRPKKSLTWVLAMRMAIPLVKPMTIGPGNELHRRTHASRAHDHEQYSGHHRAHEQAVNAVNRDDPGDDNNECAGRSADLRLRAAEQRR